MTATRVVLALTVSLLVSACSGDGTLGNGSSGLNAIGYKIKQLAFTWSAVSGVDTFRLLENPDGVSGYSQIGADFSSTTLAYDHDIAVHLHDWNNASYILQSCTSGSCTDSAARTATDSSAAIGYFKASNTGFGDNFGQAVAVSDDGGTVAIGAWAEDSDPALGETDESLLDSGAVYVFRRVSDVWQGPIQLKASNAESGDQFGIAVALSGDGATLAVGAWQEAGNGTAETDNSAVGAGAVYLFTRDAMSGLWTQQGYLKAANAGAGDLFGQALALSDDGNTLAVGAPGEDGAADGVTDSGAAYTFTRSGGMWTQQAYLKASNAAANEGFGNALSLSADGAVLAVGASLEDDGFNADNGAVYLFSFAASWTETTVLRASNVDAGDHFGAALALSGHGTTLAVGAPFEDSDGLSPLNENATNSGAVYVFTDSGVWAEQAMVKAAVVGAFDRFGLSVALGGATGDILAVGADQEDGGASGVGGDAQLNDAIEAGAGYSFIRDTGVWSQHAYLKAPNTDSGDRFGTALAMSADGRTLAIGAIGEDSAATGIGGDQGNDNVLSAGAVYLY